MNISTKQLKAFVYAAQLGSFTRAAERLHVTQTGLSAIMRELESQLDARLFDRTTRVISLTEAGRKLLPRAVRMLEDLDVAVSEVSAIETHARQTLRVGATPLVASRLLPTACALFHRRQPEVTVRIVEIERDLIEEQLDSGQLDMGLGIFLKAAAGIDRQRLFNSRLFCVSMSPRKRGNPLSQIGTMSWRQLAGRPLVSLPSDNPVQQLIERYLPPDSLGEKGRYSVNHIETQIAMAAIGAGAAIVPSFALPACRHHRVQVDLLKDPPVDVGFFRIMKKGRHHAGAATGFADTLVSVLRPLLRH
ncbi:MAG: LysR family transcriptional regulator [Burkholderiales bacterium]|nr:LysR family transcriptional regulator [Burkholderiales bacterium]